MADLNTTETSEVTVADSAGVNKLLVNADGSINVVSSGGAASHTRVMKTGTITTTATTADQVVLTYTVTALKTFYLSYLDVFSRHTTFPGNVNPVRHGSISLEIVAGTKVITYDTAHLMVNPNSVTFPVPLQVAAGTVVRVVCTPAAATSFVWRANFGGYEI